MENIFRSELIQKYRKSVTANTGEITDWNGDPCISISPAPFYKNLDDGNTSAILRDEFLPNTQYIFDLWVDYDGSYSNGAYRQGGFTVYYTDDTNSGGTLRGTGGDGIGFQHKKLITPAGKSVKYINVYYGYNVPVYYRLDSYICPVSTLKVNKQGQIITTTTVEDKEQASFLNGGSMYCDNFYEY